MLTRRSILPSTPEANVGNGQDLFVDGDIDAAQIVETGRGAAKSAVPRFFFGFVGDDYVQVELAESKGFGAGGEGVEAVDEFGEESGICEGEFIGGVENAICFVVDLSTRAEEIEGEMHGLHAVVASTVVIFADEF